MILSQARCGSTWLQFMLNALPGFASDFEVNWTSARTTKFHRALKSEPLDFIFGEIASPTAHFVGTKLVIAPDHDVTRIELGALVSAIQGVDVVIRITRPYFESYYSKMVGGGHLRNPDGVAAPPRTGAWLDDAPKFLPRLSIQPIHIDLAAFEDNLQRRHEAEFVIEELAVRSDAFNLEYRQIAAEFPYIVRLLTPDVPKPVLQHVMRNPPVVRGPKPEPRVVIVNWDEVRRLALRYEQHRRTLVQPAATSPATA